MVARVERWRDAHAFLGRMAAAMASTIVQPGTRRQREIVCRAEEIGYRVLPLISPIGSMFGLTLSLQFALPTAQCGAARYVASLVSVSVLHELGPLFISAILDAPLSAVFAGEIGTTKVNQGIDALTEMGFDPLRFLGVPPLIAAVAMAVVLIVAMNLNALAGMVAAMTSLDSPLAVLSTQVVTWSTPSDVFRGLATGLVFGAVMVGIGCARGMGTRG